jgi:CheY-like chemotaxis protein
MERVILLVEDDEIDAESILRGLSKAGDPHKVVWKTSAEEAWAWLQSRGQVQVVGLVDINLPGMNGFEFAERWKNQEPAVVWFLSSSVDQDEIDQAYASCAAGYFVKQSSAEAVRRIAETLSGFLRSARLPSPAAS